MVDYKAAYDVWQDKTDWVQEGAKTHELGMHRADVLKVRILTLEAAAKKPVKVTPVITQNKVSDTFEDYCKTIGLEPPTDDLHHRAFKAWVSGFNDSGIIRAGRDMSHNLTGNGFLFHDEAQLIRFARELVARALGV